MQAEMRAANPADGRVLCTTCDCDNFSGKKDGVGQVCRGSLLARRARSKRQAARESTAPLSYRLVGWRGATPHHMTAFARSSSASLSLERATGFDSKKMLSKCVKFRWVLL